MMIQKGSRIWRQDRGKASALEIIQYLMELKRPASLAIQEEMSKGAKLEETAAGQEVRAELEKQKKEFERQIKEIKEEMEEAIVERDRERQQELHDLMAQLKAEQEEAIDNERKLAADREELRRQEEEEDRKESAKYQEQLLRMQQEIARGEYELKLMEQRHNHELEKQKWSKRPLKHKLNRSEPRTSLKLGRKRERRTRKGCKRNTRESCRKSGREINKGRTSFRSR
jgi:hypothetical protein